MPAPPGNQHAKKEKPKSASVNIRIEPQLKSQAQEQAERIGLTLSEYVVRCVRSDLGI